MSGLDETVTLAPYDPSWPAAFEAERRRLRGVPGITPEAIEHIGSTAVPGLTAKPVVDLMLGVTHWPPPAALVAQLVVLGYEDLGEAGVPERRYLRLRGPVSFNLHVVRRDGDHWSNNLRLRDHLRADPIARERYAAAKRAAVAAGATRLLAYSAAKQPAIAELLAVAPRETAL
ncbi:MAG TPA: GrpB family protein [Steroidobacteraceae bacterium]|nr:GrpB family protein [Steroidobacteraceae bacterium]